MPKLQKHETFTLERREAPLPDGFFEKLAGAYGAGLTCGFEVGLWFLDKPYLAKKTEIGKSFRTHSKGCSGVSNAYWAAFFLGFGANRKMSSHAWKWECYISQQLAKAFARLPEEGADILWQAHGVFGLTAQDWTRGCSGALAVARVVHALAPHGGSCYLPHIKEDARGKIDLIYQGPSLDRGCCLQIKGEHRTSVTSGRAVDEAVADSDTSGYLRRMLIGVRQFAQYNPGDWRPILLTVGQWPYRDTRNVRQCPEIAQGVTEALSLL